MKKVLLIVIMCVLMLVGCNKTEVNENKNIPTGEKGKVIDVFENGVIIDGNHTARAAANLNHLVDVYVHAGKGKTAGLITKVPFRK